MSPLSPPRAAWHTARRCLAGLLGAAMLPWLTGCATVGYYWQATQGHLALMQAARPIDAWLTDTATPQRLRERLRLAQRMRAFAIDALQLPDNASYRRYADLHRPYAVWNVVAAPADSLTVKTWCFPVTGCVGYRGYFREADARAMAAQLRAQAFEVTVYGVPAYSTLGWTNWAGGDPLLSTFALGHEGDLARLMFHELAHQVAYASGDTAFNESFATAVERLGTAQWLASEAGPRARETWTMVQRRREAFRSLTRATRAELVEIYEKNRADPIVNSRLSAIKNEVMARFRARYAALKVDLGGDAAGWRGYDAWVADANNASFGALAAYDDLVPGFEALFTRSGGATPEGWRRFYDAVRRLAALPSDERRRALAAG